MRLERIPTATAILHAIAFAATVAYVYSSSDPQASLVWLTWFVPDFPVSLLHYLGPEYSRWIHTVVTRDSFLDHVLYTPHIVYGLLGTGWWYLMPRAIITGFSRWRGRRVAQQR